MRVIVVGAGLAGLSAADNLAKAGVDVVVIEASSRVGGRVRTVHDRFMGAQYAESGAEWVDSVHLRMLGLMNRFGVSTIGAGTTWSTIRRWLFWDGRLFPAERLSEIDPRLTERIDSYDAAIDSLADGFAAVAAGASNPLAHPDAERLDALSLADVMRGNASGVSGVPHSEPLDGPSALLARRNSQGEFADEPSNVSLLFVAQQRAQERELARCAGVDVLAYRVDGGLSQIAQRWAAQMSTSPQSRVEIRLSHQLLAVDQDADGIHIHVGVRGGTHGGVIDLDADHVVLATSLVPLRSVEFATPLPDELRAAVHGLSYGTVTKTAVQFERRAWEAGYGTTDSVSQRVYDCAADQARCHTGNTHPGILMSYCGGDGGRRLAGLTESQRIAEIDADIRRIHGLGADDAAGGVQTTGAFSRAWSAEPRYGGSYAVYSPGQVTAFWNVLRRPWGRVHLAGEHVATCTGYMEGAVESGETVARRILGD